MITTGQSLIHMNAARLAECSSATGILDRNSTEHRNWVLTLSTIDSVRHRWAPVADSRTLTPG